MIAIDVPFLFFRLSKVCEVTGLSKSTIYRLQAAKEFPRAFELGPKCRGWQ